MVPKVSEIRGIRITAVSVKIFFFLSRTDLDPVYSPSSKFIWPVVAMI
jgi:hypothetical protein